MRALGVHTYLGGFQMGLEDFTNHEVVGSVESWSGGIDARKIAGVGKTLGFGKFPQADMVFANPPCSRFSQASSHAYSSEQKSDFGRFDELKDVAKVTFESGAQIMWWETGPLCYTAGRGMVRSTHRGLKEHWGECTTLLVRYDPRWSGLPQRRPRTHIIHMSGTIQPGEVPQCQWPIELRLYDWIRSKLGDRSEEFPIPFPEDYGSPMECAKFINLISTFGQGDPQPIHPDEHYGLTVLSGRIHVWEHIDAWWTAEEYATLMGVRPEVARAIAEQSRNPIHAITMLSKGVSPVAAKAVSDIIGACGVSERDPAWSEWEEGLYELDLNIRDNPKRRHGLPKIEW
jgi:hypothetical protein